MERVKRQGRFPSKFDGFVVQMPGKKTELHGDHVQGDVDDLDSVLSSSSSGSRSSTALRAEAIEAALRLGQVDEEFELQKKLVKLRLKNKRDLKEKVAKALEREDHVVRFSELEEGEITPDSMDEQCMDDSRKQGWDGHDQYPESQLPKQRTFGQGESYHFQTPTCTRNERSHAQQFENQNFETWIPNNHDHNQNRYMKGGSKVKVDSGIFNNVCENDDRSECHSESYFAQQNQSGSRGQTETLHHFDPQLVGRHETDQPHDSPRYGQAENQLYKTRNFTAQGSDQDRKHQRSRVDTTGEDRTSDARQGQPPDQGSRMAKLMYLSSLEPVKFSGSPRDFPDFMRRCRALLDDGMLYDHEKVELLPKLLSGDPLSTVKLLQGRSYGTVMARLKERYGHPALVAKDYAMDLVSGPGITPGDRKALLNYADRLSTASEVLEGEYMRLVSCQPNMEKMANRLPSYVQAKWEKVSRTICDKGQMPGLEDLAALVADMAKVKNNPFFQAKYPTQGAFGARGPPAPPSHSQSRSTTNLRPGGGGLSAFGTVVRKDGTTQTTSSAACPVCSGQHQPWICEKLKALTPRERLSLIMTKQLCFACFGAGCNSSRCRYRDDTRYVCRECDRPHNKLLHCYRRDAINSRATGFEEADDSGEPENKSAEEQYEENAPFGEVDEHHSSEVPAYEPEDGSTDVLSAMKVTAPGPLSPDCSFMLAVLPIKIVGRTGTLTTYAFPDPGSRGTFIDSGLARRLGIVGVDETRVVKTVTGRKPMKLQRVKFDICPVDGLEPMISVDYQTFSLDLDLADILPSEEMPSMDEVRKYPHLQNVSWPRVDVPSVGLLIGLPIREAHQVTRYMEGGRDEPFAVVTPLGTALAGPFGKKDGPGTLGCHVTVTAKRQPLRSLLENLWRMEEYGMDEDPLASLSPDDQRAIRIFEKSLVRLPNGHYQSDLLFNNEDLTLPNNRGAAKRRLLSLARKFEKDPELERMYRNAMNEYLDNGWAEKVPDDELQGPPGRTLYLSHFGVKNKNKPGKIRVVYDAADSSDGQSLNSNLLSGPDSSCSLLGVLLRSRFGKICVASDVKSMFNQCFVTPSHRDALRFLWFDENGELADYRMKVHVFGSADSPFAANRMLKQVAIDHANDAPPAVVSAVKENFYVDDCIVSAGTPKEARELAIGLKDLLSKGGFQLTKFVSNAKDVLRGISPTNWAKPELNLDLDPMPVERALGLKWDVEKDVFGFKSAQLDVADTFRGVASGLGRVFDPLGIVSPIVMRAKMIVQECWRRKLEWDEPLPQDLATSWRQWKRDVQILVLIEIPRPYFPFLSDCRADCETLQLHFFSDSSSYATGIAAYLRGVDYSGGVHVGFLIGKSRCLPLQPRLTVPRSELKAAADMVKLAENIESELSQLKDKLIRGRFWTDSVVALKYVLNDTRTFKTFVSNRRSLIREHSNVEQWHFCPGELNVADDPSRGVSGSVFSSNHRYLTGPDFLKRPESDWPGGEIKSDLPDNDPEIKKPPTSVCALVVMGSDPLGELMGKRSSYNRMTRVVAWMLRWYFRNPKRGVKWSSGASGPLTVAEIVYAENKIVGYVQAAAFTEYSLLKEAAMKRDTEFSLPSDSALLGLNPFYDVQTSVIRIGGRLSHAPLGYEVRHPAILPKPAKCHFSAVVLAHYHRLSAHGGRDMVLGRVREKYWVIGAASAVRRIIRTCITCRRRNAMPLNQLMSDLPADRVETFVPSFTNVGTDCFGPLMCRVGRRRDSKFYGVLFICLNTKAVHLELVKTLSTDDFIMALMRFVSLRSNCKSIRSDNGSNYVGAERELREVVNEWNVGRIADQCAVRGVQWTFQAPYASSMSGIWERKI